MQIKTLIYFSFVMVITVSLSAAPDAPALPVSPTPDTTMAGAPSSQSIQNLSNLSIDQLVNIQVTSAGDREQKLSDVAAALSVINSSDIERSGATNIPDLLRYTPGVQVSEANNGEASVGIRGLGGAFTSSVLVLVDGLSVYDPADRGVEWQNQRVMMENIDRVEVIRGSGSALWGANATNGVINIITKDAADTQGGYISTIYGTKESGTGEFRYGFQPIQDLSVRFYGMYQQEAPTTPDHGTQAFDTYSNSSGGFRADYRPTTDDHFTFSVDASTDYAGQGLFTLQPNPATGFQTFTSSYVRAPGFTLLNIPDYPYFTFNSDNEKANFIYEHKVDPDNIVTLQSYYWRLYDSTTPANVLYTALGQTGDFQIRHSLPINLLPIKQDLVYGAEYRLVSYETGPGLIEFTRSRADQTFSAFAQTDLHLIEDTLTFTTGVRYEHNDYSGSQVLPSIRLLGKINSTNSLWLAASRSVVDPNLADTNGAGLLQSNNQYYKSEDLREVEIGYRTQPFQNLSFDITPYYKQYSNLLSTYSSSDPRLPFLPVTQVDRAEIFGIEPSFQAELQPWWHLNGSYSFNKVNYHPGPPLANYTVLDSSFNRENVNNQASVHTSFDLPEHISLDIGERYSEGSSFGSGYTVTDIRVGWKPNSNWDLSVNARNLFMANHIEDVGAFNNAAYVGPEVYGKIAYNF